MLGVDDDPDVRSLLSALLSKAGYRVESGAEAILMLEEMDVPVALLVDLLMPGIVGQELIEYVRATPRLATIPVAIVSGSPELAPAGYRFLESPSLQCAPRLRAARAVLPVAAPRIFNQPVAIGEGARRDDVCDDRALGVLGEGKHLGYHPAHRAVRREVQDATEAVTGARCIASADRSRVKKPSRPCLMSTPAARDQHRRPPGLARISSLSLQGERSPKGERSLRGAGAHHLPNSPGAGGM